MPTLSTVLVLLCLWLSALRSLYKFAPYPTYLAIGWGVGLMMIGGIWIRFLRHQPWVRQLLCSRWLTYVLIGGMAVACYVIYPIADARKLEGKGSTGDDAMIAPAQALLAEGRLYDVALYDGAPISPGPGWIVLHAPLTWAGVYWLITPLYLLLLTWLWRRLIDAESPTPNLWLLLLSASPLFWELMLTGHDLVALGISLVAATLALRHLASSHQSSGPWLWIVLCWIGILSTSRIVFVCYPILMAWFLWHHGHRRLAGLTLLVSLGLTLGLHLWAYLAYDPYPPLHLFGRGERNVGGWLIMVGAVLTGITVLYQGKNLKPTPTGWLQALVYSLLVPLSTIALGEWIAGKYDFALWEGANYLMPAMIGLVLMWAHSSVRQGKPQLEST